MGGWFGDKKKKIMKRKEGKKRKLENGIEGWRGRGTDKQTEGQEDGQTRRTRDESGVKKCILASVMKSGGTFFIIIEQDSSINSDFCSDQINNVRGGGLP